MVKKHPKVQGQLIINIFQWKIWIRNSNKSFVGPHLVASLVFQRFIFKICCTLFDSPKIFLTFFQSSIFNNRWSNKKASPCQMILNLWQSAGKGKKIEVNFILGRPLEVVSEIMKRWPRKWGKRALNEVIFKLDFCLSPKGGSKCSPAAF